MDINLRPNRAISPRRRGSWRLVAARLAALLDGRLDLLGAGEQLLGACRLLLEERGQRGDGNYDQTRDWFYQNVRLKEALVAKGYDVNYVWGIGVHSHDMGAAMLPEMMRWLWRDYKP